MPPRSATGIVAGIVLWAETEGDALAKIGATMYPSGRWRGFWQQIHLGRQSMRDLVLYFSADEIEGRGVDVVGPFTFHGTYDGAGNVTLIKRYRLHQVLYEGRYDGEGTIFGEWSIAPFWRGPFALTPQSSAPPADAAIQEIGAAADQEGSP
jgi:hypothetical protein